jgi:hypothetical protein
VRTSPVRLFGGIVCLLLCFAVATFGQDEPVQAFRGGEALTLIPTADGARIELPGGRAVQVALPAGGELTTLAATDGGWMAAGTERDANGHQRLFLLRGNDRASRPLAEPPGQEGRERRSPVLLVDGDRLAGLAWLEGEDHRTLSVRAALWNGKRWQTPERVSFTGPGSQLALTGAVLADGSWLLAWSAFDGQDDEIVWARRAGDAWQPVKRLGPGNSVPDITPSLAATANGGALIAWNHFDGKGYELRMARFSGEGWRDERAAAPAGSLFPKFLGGSRLLYVNAVPHAWTVLDLDAAGRVKARATVASPLDRPVVSFEGSKVRMSWPAEKRQASASLEKVP